LMVITWFFWFWSGLVKSLFTGKYLILRKTSFIRFLLLPNVKIYTWEFPKEIVD